MDGSLIFWFPSHFDASVFLLHSNFFSESVFFPIPFLSVRLMFPFPVSHSPWDSLLFPSRTPILIYSLFFSFSYPPKKNQDVTSPLNAMSWNILDLGLFFVEVTTPSSLPPGIQSPPLVTWPPPHHWFQSRFGITLSL